MARGRSPLLLLLRPLAAFVLLASVSGRALGGRDDQGASTAVESYGDVEHLAQARRLAEAALRWLAERIDPDGSYQGTHSTYEPRVASTALAALAFMANGHTADEGEDGQGVRLRALLKALMSQVALTNCTCSLVKGEHKVGQFVSPGFTTSDMHGQGYATWALAMAYGMSFGTENVEQRERLKSILQAATHCIELAQHHTGGWDYHFVPGEDGHEGSVTVTVLQALRASKEAGLRVDAGVIERAVQYLRNSQVSTPPDDRQLGAFRYKLHDSHTSFALTAAAVSSLNQTGDYDSKAVDLGIEYMRQKNPLMNFSQDPDRWPWYGRFYASQAFWQYKELRHFRNWYPKLVEEAANEQGRDGSFRDGEFGDVYATAMAALTLAVPFGYLPSFQR